MMTSGSHVKDDLVFNKARLDDSDIGKVSACYSTKSCEQQAAARHKYRRTACFEVVRHEDVSRSAVLSALRRSSALGNYSPELALVKFCLKGYCVLPRCFGVMSAQRLDKALLEVGTDMEPR